MGLRMMKHGIGDHPSERLAPHEEATLLEQRIGRMLMLYAGLADWTHEAHAELYRDVGEPR